MSPFEKILKLWAKISLYGIFTILLIISGFIITDLIGFSSHGYKSSDLKIVAFLIALTLILFLIVRIVLKAIGRR